MGGTADEEVRPVSKDEIKAGVKARAGHSIVFVVDGIRGSSTPPGDADPAGTDPEDPGPGPAKDPRDDTPAPAPAAADGGSASLKDDPAAPSTAPAAAEGALDLQLFTASGAPAASFEVELILPDGTKVAGETDAAGHFAAAHLPVSGSCTLQLPDIDEGAPAAVTPPPPAGRLAYLKDMALPIGTPAAIQLPPRVHRGELTGMHFETDKSFLLPSAMPGIRQLVIIYKSFRASSVLVDGHTDTVGPADYNRGLSEERAASIAAFLTDDVDGWLKNYQPQAHSKAWGAHEDRLMQQFLGLPETQVSGDARRALITQYMNTDGTSLPAGTKMSTHGCGLTHLKVPTPLGVANAENRRVEVFLFDGDVSPPPQTPCPPGGCAEHDQWVGQTLNTVDLDQPLPSLEVQVTDGSAGVDGVAVHLAGPTPQDATTAGGGKASFPALVPGKYKGVASLDGFSAADGEIEVKEGANPPLVLTLQALAELDVTLTLTAPQKSGQVTATPLGKPLIGPVDASPTAKFHRLPLDPCTLNASAPFHRQQIQAVTPVRGANSVTLALVPFGEVAGKITDGTNPVPNASLQLTGPSPRAGNSDGSGDYDFGNLPVGSYTLKITKPGFEDFQQAVTLSATRTKMDVTLTALTLDAFVRFEAWNLKTLAFEPVANMPVDAVADHTLGDQALDTHPTDATGLAHLQVFSKNRKPGEAIDLKFIAHPAGRVIGGVTFPDQWTTKGWLATDNSQGMRKDFKDASLGSPGAPIVFRIGLDLHLRFTYDVPANAVKRKGEDPPPPGTFNAVKGVEVEIHDVGKFALDKTGQLHALTFALAGGKDVIIDVTGRIENPEITLKRAKFNFKDLPGWRTPLKDNARTSIGTQAEPRIISGLGPRAAAMYAFKVLSEWSQFLTVITDHDWDGIQDMDIDPDAFSSKSFPVGTLDLETEDAFSRPTISHELTHKIMWKLAGISSLDIFVLGSPFGELRLKHTWELLSNETTALIEGWAEFVEFLFVGKGRGMDLLFGDIGDKKPTIKLRPPDNQGERVEGCFGMALYHSFINPIGGGDKIPESADGDVLALQPLMGDASVRKRWKSMFWEVLKEMKSAKPFGPRTFLERMKARNPELWHNILPNLHAFNLMVDSPVVSSISPATAATTDTLTITGIEFEDPGTTVEFDGTPVAVKPSSSTKLEVSLPDGPKGKVKVVVRTSAGTSIPRQITRS